MQASLIHKIDPPFCCQWWTQRKWNEISIFQSCLKTWAWWYLTTVPVLRNLGRRTDSEGNLVYILRPYLRASKQIDKQKIGHDYILFLMVLFTSGIIYPQYKFLPIGWCVKEMGYIDTYIISKMHGPFHLWKHGWSWRSLGQHRKENIIWYPMSRI